MWVDDGHLQAKGLADGISDSHSHWYRCEGGEGRGAAVLFYAETEVSQLAASPQSPESLLNRVGMGSEQTLS